MKRKIIKIDEEKCNGCGVCISGCPEGALQILDGKAKLVKDSFCDGLGACIGDCPRGAILVEERESEAYDEISVIKNIAQKGEKAVIDHLKHLEDHNETEALEKAVSFLGLNRKVESHNSCPGSRTMDFRAQPVKKARTALDSHPRTSELRQWPIQLHLLNPAAPYFEDAELVIAADCVGFAHPDFHGRFLKGKTLIMFCPKLDTGIDVYIDKLAQIFTMHNIKSVTMVHMEVPCCFGVGRIVEQALMKSGKNIFVKDYTVSIKGEII